MPSRPLADLEEMVGDTHRTVVDFAVERGKVAEFARAVRDPADVYLDEDAAREAGYETIPAPPTFARTSFFPRYRPEGVGHDLGFDLGFDRSRVVHGEQSFTYDRPLYVGDVLTGDTTLSDVYQRDGRGGGTMTFAVLTTEFTDESGARVLEAENTRIETGQAIEGESS